jgi:hypothetical protein
VRISLLDKEININYGESRHVVSQNAKFAGLYKN